LLLVSNSIFLFQIQFKYPDSPTLIEGLKLIDIKLQIDRKFQKRVRIFFYYKIIYRSKFLLRKLYENYCHLRYNNVNSRYKQNCPPLRKEGNSLSIRNRENKLIVCLKVKWQKFCN